jgi:hypothetical protein
MNTTVSVYTCIAGKSASHRHFLVKLKRDFLSSSQVIDYAYTFEDEVIEARIIVVQRFNTCTRSYSTCGR